MESPRITAARQGQRKYVGKPCPRCGCKERYVINAGCVDCTKKGSSAVTDKVRGLLDQAAKAGV